MRIVLIPELFMDMDVDFNMSQMIHWLDYFTGQDVDLVVFGEAFLQGFGAINADYEHDLELAVAQDDAVILQLREACRKAGLALAFGYIEKVDGKLYSACMVIGPEGETLHNFRRVSPGWKLGSAFEDDRYQEGNVYRPFDYRGKTIDVAICGDLWYENLIENYEKVTADFTLWPLYTNYDIETWEGGEKQEYALRVASLNRPVLMVNCIDEGENIAVGGAFVFEDGKVKQELSMGEKGFLVFEC